MPDSVSMETDILHIGEGERKKASDFDLHSLTGPTLAKPSAGLILTALDYRVVPSG
jgi:hypothetical protein